MGEIVNLGWRVLCGMSLPYTENRGLLASGLASTACHRCKLLRSCLLFACSQLHRVNTRAGLRPYAGSRADENRL